MKVFQEVLQSFHAVRRAFKNSAWPRHVHERIRFFIDGFQATEYSTWRFWLVRVIGADQDSWPLCFISMMLSGIIFEVKFHCGRIWGAPWAHA